MKKFCLLLFLCMAAASAVSGQELIEKGHPRLLMSDTAFADYKEAVESGANEALSRLHEACMALADQAGTKPLTYTKDASGRRLLAMSRRALTDIFASAYAYRFTGDRRYLEEAEKELLTVCAFPDWNPSHYLDVGEMAAAAAFGYDWLYHDLRPKTRTKILRALRSFAFETSADRSLSGFFYGAQHNWNQVCNGGLVCAALATWESNESDARRIVNDAVRSNLKAMEHSYAPDGNYAEGPSYWEYGTSFEVLMLSVMDSCLGTDFGIGGMPGFDRTADYMLYSLGPSREFFNFSDNAGSERPAGSVFYFAGRFGKPYLMHHQLRLLREGRYETAGDEKRLLPMFAYHAYLAGPADESVTPAPVFAGRGVNPVVLVRTAWTDGPEDRFLGFKGGMAGANHGHMDAGSFVYDAYGMRWASDLGAEKYAAMEVAFNKIYGNRFWDRTQKSPRWEVFRYGSLRHNTLTVNGHRHRVNGAALLEEVFDSDAEKGGSVDLGPVFAGDLASAHRKAVIVDDSFLQVTDVLAAPADAPAQVRWSMVTPADVSIAPEGIKLTQGGVTLTLSTVGADVEYCSWSCQPADYDSPLAPYESPNAGCTICGFTFTIPAGESRTLVTTLR